MEPTKAKCKMRNIPQSDIVPYLVGHWSDEQKQMLFSLMKKHGSMNHDAIAAELPMRTKSEVVEAIEYYKKTSFKLYGTYRGLKGKQINPKDETLDIGLSYWISLITRTFPEAQLNNELSEALLIIAENSDIPSLDKTNGIDFKNIYICIAKALVGESGPELNNISTLLLKKNLNNLLQEAYKTLLTPNIEHYLELMLKPDLSVLPLRSDTDDPEQSLMEHILSVRSGNPFGMDIESLNVPIVKHTK